MLTFFYIVQFIISVILILLIFVQKREDATSLLSTNVYNSMFKNMVAPSNPLLKVTLVIGALFFINCIVIGALMIRETKGSNSLINNVEKYSTQKNVENKNVTDSSKKEEKKTPEVPLSK